MWTFAGAGVATAGALLHLGGYPAQPTWALSQAQTGFVLARLPGAGWGSPRFFAAARRYALAEAMTRATLVCAAAGVLVALVGVTATGQGSLERFRARGCGHGVRRGRPAPPTNRLGARCVRRLLYGLCPAALQRRSA
jgi:hypothetical protein